MESFQHIKLSFKCPKTFNDLQPCQNNWYCDSCRKMVYDFRGMSQEQVLNTFEKNGQKLCGIYDAESITVSPQPPRWLKWLPAVMALGIALLNGCGWGQKQPSSIVGQMPIIRPVHTAGIVMPQQDTDTTKRHHQKRKIKFPLPVFVKGVGITSPKDTFAKK